VEKVSRATCVFVSVQAAFEREGVAPAEPELRGRLGRSLALPKCRRGTKQKNRRNVSKRLSTPFSTGQTRAVRTQPRESGQSGEQRAGQRRLLAPFVLKTPSHTFPLVAKKTEKTGFLKEAGLLLNT